MEDMRWSPVEIGSLSHYLQGCFYTSQESQVVVSEESEA